MIAGVEVGIDQMLEEREWRYTQGQQLVEHVKREVLVCVTLNIAGPVKRFPLADESFEEAKRQIEEALEGAGFGFGKKAERVSACGHCAFYQVDGTAESVKRLLCQIEKTHPLGALMDLDVLEKNGSRVGRSEIGEQERRCLICEEPSHACARSRAHTVEELQCVTWGMMRGFFDVRFAERVRTSAEKALLYELSATPKPGLIDRTNNGSHRNMDFFTFIRSTAAIGKCFAECALLGMKEEDERALFEALRPVGKKAERAMLSETGGVNTHRGAIFTLGLIAAACGWLYARGEGLESGRILQVVSKVAQGALESLSPVKGQTDKKSNGQKVFERYGVGGVRQEAAAGYPSIRDVGLPCLERWLERGASENDASVAVLIGLMAHLEDTNVLSRSDAEKARSVKERAREIWELAEETGEVGEGAQILDCEMMGLGLSPGGCADILAATWMVYFLCGGSIS